MNREMWRFIDTGSMDGPSNMALDEALLASFDPEVSAPVFRLYGWQPTAFSVGRFQDPSATLDLGKCRECGVAAVRRMTAGGIIYHADEITYSIVCSPRHVPGVRAVKESFRKLCGFLLLSYGKLGLDAGFAVDRNPGGMKLGQRTALCFAGKEEYDIVVDGRKVGGNAQRRIKGKIFQHGSLPLTNSLQAALEFVQADEIPSMLHKDTVSLGQLNVYADRCNLKDILAEAFEENFGVSLRPSSATADEIRLAEYMRENKYSRDAWNFAGNVAK